MFLYYFIILLHPRIQFFRSGQVSFINSLDSLKMRTETIAHQLKGIEKVLAELTVSNKKVLNSAEAAIYLKHTRGHIYRLVSKEGLPYFRPKGTRLYFKRKELNYWRLTRQHPVKAKATKQILGFSQNGK